MGDKNVVELSPAYGGGLWFFYWKIHWKILEAGKTRL